MKASEKGLEDRVGVFQKMVWTIIGLLGGILVGAVAIYAQIGDLKTDVAVIKTNLVNLVERFARLEDEIKAGREAARAEGGRIQATLGRIESRLLARDPVLAGVYVTESEAVLIRQILNIAPKNDLFAPTFLSAVKCRQLN